MSVLQRCPSCGTAQSNAGECETCHAAAVQYFCTNHEPGQWLTGPSCPRCETKRPHALPAQRQAPSEHRHHAPMVARAAHPATPEWEPTSPRQLGGCLLRLALIGLLVLVVVVFALYLVGRSLS